MHCALPFVILLTDFVLALVRENEDTFDYLIITSELSEKVQSLAREPSARRRKIQ